MAEIVNLRRARKARDRKEKAERAEENRVAHGIGKAARRDSARERARRRRELDGKKLDES